MVLTVMQRYLIIALLAFVLASCAPVENQQVMEPDLMVGMPCHRMPDGSWMGDCDTQDALSDSERSGDAAQASERFSLSDGDVFELEAHPVAVSLAGRSFDGYAYNGMIPGPQLIVDRGAHVSVPFTNGLDEETTVHWHGLRHDVRFDGVPEFSQDPVRPGETFTYELFFPDEGVFWYHPHVREDRQQDLGLSGVMIVRDPENYPDVDSEEVVVLDDILFDDERIAPYGSSGETHTIMGRFGNEYMINGAERYELETGPGVVRFYLANVANARPFNIAIEDHDLKRVAGEIGRYERDELVQSVLLAPAQRVVIDVAFDEPGTYDLINRQPERDVVIGSIKVVDGTGTDALASFASLSDHDDVRQDIRSFEQHFDRDPDWTIELDVDWMQPMAGMPCHQMPDGSWMGDCEDAETDEHDEDEDHAFLEWEDEMPLVNAMSNTFNTEWIMRDASSGLENMDMGLEASVGDVVKIRFENLEGSDHPMQHPIHLHGQRFLVLERNGEVQENLVWQDTVLLPIAESAEILVDVTNPGPWMMHCHIAEHLGAGMMTVIDVQDA